MAIIPIYGRFIGDFTAHLVVVDTEDTIDAVAAKIARHVIGRRLPEPAGAPRLEVLMDGCPLEPSSCLKALALQPLQWLDVRWKS